MSIRIPISQAGQEAAAEHGHGEAECRQLGSLTAPAGSGCREESPGRKPRVLGGRGSPSRRSLVSDTWHRHTWSLHSPQGQPPPCQALLQPACKALHMARGDPQCPSIFPENRGWELPKGLHGRSGSRGPMRAPTRSSLHHTGRRG